ncbi:MAG: hypothetical protein ACPGVG_06140 [Mycobacterium sp.]
MAIDLTKYRRDKGEVSIGGSALGMLDPFEAAIDITYNWEKIPIKPVETGVLSGVLHAGIDVAIRVVAGEKNAATTAAAFNDWASGVGETIDATTYVPGQEIAGVAFSFAGRLFTYTAANCVVTIASDPHNVGVPQRSQPFILDVLVMKHTDDNLIAKAETP